jgi:hypothetical protein
MTDTIITPQDAPTLVVPTPQPASDPNDYTGKYNTKLSPDDEKKFQAWLVEQSKASGHDMTNDLYDYDLRGAWKAGAGKSANGHMTDEFKKPNHPTFSNESKYSGQDGNVGGKWVEQNGKTVYVPSATNLQHYPPAALSDYFRRVEPDIKLQLPGVQ